MDKTDLKRQQLLGKIADHLLASGIEQSSLRQLAAAIGTSDRMLLHYFEDKEALMRAALTLVATRMIGLLDSVRSGQVPYQTLLIQLAGMLQEPTIRPYLRLWLQLTALSASNDSYRTIAHLICEHFYTWIAASLAVTHEEERTPLAALAFVTIEGMVLLDALGAHTTIASALQGVAIQRAS